MGEVEKKPEESKMEEKKAEEKKDEKPKAEESKKEEKKKTEETKAAAPTAAAEVVAPPEIVLRVYMHCEGCARKVRRCLKGFDGVEDVTTDCKTHKVVVKGEKADPLKVLERVQKKSHRQVELLSPIPKPQSPPAEGSKEGEKEVAKPEEKKEEPQVITVVLKVHMHCEACAQEIKRRILRMKGVEKVEPDFKSSQVTVIGVFDPPKLIEYIHKRTGKHVTMVKQEPEKKEEEAKEKKEGEKPKAEEKKKKSDGEGTAPVAGDAKTGEAAKKAGGGAEVPAAVVPPPNAAGDEAGQAMEMKKSEFYYTDPVNFQIYPHQQRFDNAYAYYAPAPQMFSDENPNACTVM